MPRQDRRRSARHAIKHCTVSYRKRKLVLFFEGGPHKSPVIDLSSHGFGFLTSRMLKVGDILVTSFDLPFEVYAVRPGFKLKAVVRWIKLASGKKNIRRVGCEFAKLKKDDQTYIQRIIQYGILKAK